MRRLFQCIRLGGLLAALACGIPARAACANTSYANGWTCVQGTGLTSNAGAGASITLTFGSNVVAGHIISVISRACNDAPCATNGTQTASISGNAVGSCVQDAGTPVNTTSHWRYFAFVCTTASTGTQVTVTASGSMQFLGGWIAEWIGGSARFGNNGNISSGTGTSSSVTHTVAGTSSLFICSTSNQLTAAITPGSGFTEISETNNGGESEAKTGVSGSQSGTSSWTGSLVWDSYCGDVSPLLGPPPMQMMQGAGD